MTQVFKVWDALNQNERDAREIEARAADEAAEEYAERDGDGQADGLYNRRDGYTLTSAKDGHPICVRGPDGVCRKFLVGVVELRPVFASHEVSAEQAPEEPGRSATPDEPPQGSTGPRT